MNATPAFTLEISQNPCLPLDGDEMHAILTVTAEGLGAYTPTVAEVILVDSSGSMAERITRTPAVTRTSDARIGIVEDHSKTKIAAARRASAAAIDALRDGALFAIVAGTHQAEMVYPPRLELAVATPETKAAAKSAVTRMTDHGGTAIGTWLTRALELFDTRPATIRHVILLTDGRDESERRADLEAALTACEGTFSCDARGIGDGWASNELRLIVDRLGGAADAVRDGSELEADFREMTRTAMGKAVSDVRIVVRPVDKAEVVLMKQVQPTERDLMEEKKAVDDRTVAYSTGSWGDDSRDYHLCVRVDPAERPREKAIRLAQVDLEIDWAGGAEPARHGTPGKVLAQWTTDALLSSRIDSKVGHFTEHVALREAVNAGIDAYEAGDFERAAEKLGEAVKLAQELNNEKNLYRLKHLVDIDDAENGIVRLKEEISAFDLKSARLISHHWSKGRPPGDSGEKGDQRVVGSLTCPNSKCGRVVPSGSKHCAQCGIKLDTR